MKKRLFLLFLPFFLVGCTATMRQDNLLSAMAQLDKKLLPVWGFASLNRQKETGIALRKAEPVWQAFYQQYAGMEIKYGIDIVDRNWKKDFKMADKLFSSAESYATAKQLQQASRKMIQIRQVFYQLRNRHGWPYFLDGLDAFTRQVEQLVPLIRQKKVAPKEWQSYLRATEKAEERWQKVLAQAAKIKNFDLGEKQKKKLEQQLQQQQKNLRQLRGKILAADQKSAAETLLNINKQNLAIYKLFGDFTSVLEEAKAASKK